MERAQGDGGMKHCRNGDLDELDSSGIRPHGLSYGSMKAKDPIKTHMSYKERRRGNHELLIEERSCFGRMGSIRQQVTLRSEFSKPTRDHERAIGQQSRMSYNVAK